MSKKTKNAGDFWDDFWDKISDGWETFIDKAQGMDYGYSSSEIQQGGHKVQVITTKGNTTIKVDGKEVWTDKK